jgi:hypothetical protein
VENHASCQREEHAVGLYERLVQEAAELPKDPNRNRNKRMSGYLRSRKKPV